MIKKSDLKIWVLEALRALGGAARVVEVAKYIWDNHESDLQGSDLLYTWQYDMRWAAFELKREGKMSTGGKNRTWFI